jgi:hypothetical protein
MPSYEEKMEAAAIADAKEEEAKNTKRREKEAEEARKNKPKVLLSDPSKIFVPCPHCGRCVVRMNESTIPWISSYFYLLGNSTS